MHIKEGVIKDHKDFDAMKKELKEEILLELKNQKLENNSWNKLKKEFLPIFRDNMSLDPYQSQKLWAGISTVCRIKLQHNNISHISSANAEMCRKLIYELLELFFDYKEELYEFASEIPKE